MIRKYLPRVSKYHFVACDIDILCEKCLENDEEQIIDTVTWKSYKRFCGAVYHNLSYHLETSFKNSYNTYLPNADNIYILGSLIPFSLSLSPEKSFFLLM